MLGSILLYIILLIILEKIIKVIKIKNRSIRKKIIMKKYKLLYFILLVLPLSLTISYSIYPFNIINGFNITNIEFLFMFSSFGLWIYSFILSKKESIKFFYYSLWVLFEWMLTIQPLSVLNPKDMNDGGITVFINIIYLCTIMNKYYRVPLLVLFINILIYGPIFINTIKKYF